MDRDPFVSLEMEIPPNLFLTPGLVQMFFLIIQPLCMYNALCDLGPDIIYHPT